MGPTSIGYIRALQGLHTRSLALSVEDSFEALSILVSYEESLNHAHMGGP